MCETSLKQGFLTVYRVSDERAGGSIDSAAQCFGAPAGRAGESGTPPPGPGRAILPLKGEGSDSAAGCFLEHARALGATAHAFELQRLGRLVPWNHMDVFADRLRKELDRLPLPVGILAFHDIMATRVCHFFAAAGLSVPEQVAVLGIGNDPLTCDCASVPLSSVDPNRYAQGRIAAELLDRLMNGEAVPAGLVVTPSAGVVARKSTDVLAVPDLDTARALRYLWEHLAEPLSVGRVADAVGVSRRTLDRSFRAHLGRSVIDELNRKRIERACELLTGTRQSVVSIARQVGFRTEPYLFRVFRKQTGTTPKKYRLAHTVQPARVSWSSVFRPAVPPRKNPSGSLDETNSPHRTGVVGKLRG